MQLGAEGSAVGILCAIVGLLLAFVTHVLVYVKYAMTKRLAILFVIFFSFKENDFLGQLEGRLDTGFMDSGLDGIIFFLFSGLP